MIVVNESYADAAGLAANAHGLRDLFKFAVAFVAQQVHAIVQADSQLGVAIIVEIARGAAEAAAF